MKALLALAAFLGLLTIACQGGEEAPSTLTSTPTAAPSPVSGAATATPEAGEEPRLIFLRPEVDVSVVSTGVILMSHDLAGSNVVQLTPADVRASFVGLFEGDGTATLYYMAGGETGNVFTLETRDLVSGETMTLASIEAREGGSPSGSLSPDGRYVAIGYRDGIDLLDLADNSRRRVLSSDRSGCEGGGPISQCYSYSNPAWSPDGRLLLVRKTFWEGGAAVVVDPFQEEPKELRSEVIGGLSVEIASWSPTSDAWCGYGHYDSPSGLFLAEQPDWQPRNLLPEYETQEAGALWRNVTDCVWLDEHRIAFVTITTDPEGGGSEYSTSVSIYDLETAAAALLADLGVASSPWFRLQLFAVPGASTLLFNDRKGGQPGTLSTTDGARTPVLQTGDIVVAVTQPIALPEGIVAAEPEVQPCAPLIADCEVQVTNVAPDQLNVREGPGQQRVVLGQVSEGEILCLTGTSAFSGDGFRWWPVRSQAGVKGWVAGGDPQQPERPWLTATGRKCE
jgi:hypothetical protein